MRNLILPLFLFIGLTVFTGCKTEPTAPLIERNEEVNNYFVTLNLMIDEYFDLIENAIDQAQNIDEKKMSGKETSIMDGFDILSGMATSAFKITKLSKEIEEMEDQHVSFEKDLSQDDFDEFMGIYKKAIQRFIDIAKKAEELDKK